MKTTRYECINNDCPNKKLSKVVTLVGDAPHECPLKLPNCKSDYLKPLKSKNSWKKWQLAALVVVTILLALLYYLRLPTPRSASNVVVVMDGGIRMNPMLVDIPQWLAIAAGKVSSSGSLSFGIWACRPVDPDGNSRTPYRDLTSELVSTDELKNLQIPPAPDAHEITNSVPLEYDLFSAIKAAIEETKWTCDNRKLVVITASAGYGKSNTNNSMQVDENDIKKLAEQNKVSVYCILVKVPANNGIGDDSPDQQMITDWESEQNLARSQLQTLCSDKNAAYAEAVPAKSSDSETLKVSNYEQSVEDALESFIGGHMNSQPITN